jgi:3-dehydroquinate dehydratase II
MAMDDTVLVLNGPNLNLLGKRQPEIYGHTTLADVEALCRVGSAGIVINAGAYTHTSVAILDALNACEVPVIECHISNVHRREAFRHHSYISPAATAVLAGFGIHGYALSIRHLAHLRSAKG